MKMRIDTRLMLGATAGALAVVLVVSLAAYYIARHGLQEQISSHLESVAESRAAHVTTFLRQHMEKIRLAATSRVLRIGLRELTAHQGNRAMVTHDLNTRLRHFVGPDTDMDDVFLLDHRGEVVASTILERVGLDRSTDAYFVGGRNGPFIKDAHHSAATGKDALAMSAPLCDRESGDLLGVLVVRIPLDTLNAIAVDRTGLRKTGETYLVNKYGFMITPSRFRQGTFLRLKVDTENVRQALADAAAMRRGELEEQHEHRAVVSADYRGVPVLGVHAHIPQMQWCVVAEIDVDEAFASVVRFRNILVISGILFAVVALVAIWLFSRRISRPIHELHVGSERIGAGELDYRLDIRTGDEIEQLAHEFNRMAARLSESSASLEQKVADRTADLTKEVGERKRAEAQLQRYAADLARANDEIRQFAYIVSHDLRAPLVNLRGFSSELRAALDVVCSTTKELLPQLTEEQRGAVSQACREDAPEALDFIGSSVTRMDALVSAVLKLSRLGHRELAFEPVNVTEIVEAALHGLTHQIEEHGVKVTVHSLPEVVADRTSMEQIVGNLLTNAVNYLDPDRPGEIEVSGEQGRDETTFQVRDNGRGIAESDVPKVFALFRRAGRQDVPGEGMGLTYVQALVRRHGGKIWCDSELGKGTTFTFTIANHIEEQEDHA